MHVFQLLVIQSVTSEILQFVFIFLSSCFSGQNVNITGTEKAFKMKKRHFPSF